jgi:kynureninase
MRRVTIDPRALRPHYSRFLAPDRVLLTGHSHQAWPDVAREGLIESFDDAAALCDDKWGKALAKADRVRDAIATRIGARRDEIALGSSTFELVTRFLSSLDLAKRPRIVSTTGEFHSIDRLVRRLTEAGVEIALVDALPASTLAERLARTIDDRTAAALISTVLFETSSIVPNLGAVSEAAHRHGAHVLFDAYHAFNVVPQTLSDFGREPFFVTGGGYKYAQWGEGVCFLRVPDVDLRPVLTGWFSDFAHLDAARHPGPIGYGSRGADRFAGATYDPSSHYRAARVADFFDEHRLSIAELRASSLRQTARLLQGLAEFEVATPPADAERGGFVTVRVEGATEIVGALRERRIFTDARGSSLRLGPAPYVTDDEIDRAIAELRDLFSRKSR